jgi:hypothetical protein
MHAHALHAALTDTSYASNAAAAPQLQPIQLIAGAWAPSKTCKKVNITYTFDVPPYSCACTKANASKLQQATLPLTSPTLTTSSC